ncbi:hypothetical protein [Methylobacterium sp. V23]|uniref:hypothetical protein n=1 Tax=Methylobacterium sp. V23 TaxID=2044878 RepID=UPI000CDA8755|nr:hypothetical protein [Methylobacterium sp. V23]POR41087.1 hypothetical protein CRT23_20200 [Methylobacterium sp. V23]
MPDTGLASALFPSLNAARSAKQRLVSGGFARNSIDIERQGDDFEVLIHVRDEHRERAEGLLARSPGTHALYETGGQAVSAFQDNRLIALGLAGLAGLAVFSLLRRQ